MTSAGSRPVRSCQVDSCRIRAVPQWHRDAAQSPTRSESDRRTAAAAAASESSEPPRAALALSFKLFGDTEIEREIKKRFKK